MNGKQSFENNENQATPLKAEIENVHESDENKSKWDDPMYRNRVLHSALLALSGFTLGIIIGQQGPSFLDLQIITDTDVESASWFFTSASFGYMVGSFISGIVHGKINNNLLMFIVAAGGGVAAIITPHCSIYWLMLIIRFTTNFFCGGIDTIANAEHMRIWGTEGPALMQMIHFSFALGGVLTPLFTEPFLAAKEVQIENGNSSNMSSFHNATDSPVKRTTDVHYAFLIAGLLAILTSFPYLYLICFDRTEIENKEDKYMQKSTDRKLPMHIYVLLILILCLFYVVYCCVEDTFAAFLMTFVVREYEQVSKSQGAYMTTYYWAAFAVGRFSCIFVARKLTSLQIILLFSGLMVVAYSGFCATAFIGNIPALTVFGCLAGVAMAPVFPAGITWSEVELFKVTGWISSFILIGSSVGMMINPLIIGYVMEEIGNMWFCYILLGETLLMYVVFLFLVYFNRLYVNKRYGVLRQDTKNNLEVELDEEIDFKDTLTKRNGTA